MIIPRIARADYARSYLYAKRRLRKDWNAFVRAMRQEFIVRLSYQYIPPRGYGRAWTEWDTGQRVLMPIPFNYLAGLVRAVYIFIARGFYPHECCPTCHQRRRPRS